jgi:hypothetical protein
MVIRRGLQVENLFRRETPLEGPLRQRSRRSQKMVYLPQATQLPASSSLVVGDVRMSCWLALLNDNSKDVVVVRYYSRKLWWSSLRDTDLIAVCNNVGEAAFLGRNQKFENPLPRAS